MKNYLNSAATTKKIVALALSIILISSMFVVFANAADGTECVYSCGSCGRTFTSEKKANAHMKKCALDVEQPEYVAPATTAEPTTTEKIEEETSSIPTDDETFGDEADVPVDETTTLKSEETTEVLTTETELSTEASTEKTTVTTTAVTTIKVTEAETKVEEVETTADSTTVTAATTTTTTTKAPVIKEEPQTTVVKTTVVVEKETTTDAPTKITVKLPKIDLAQIKLPELPEFSTEEKTTTPTKSTTIKETEIITAPAAENDEVFGDEAEQDAEVIIPNTGSATPVVAITVLAIGAAALLTLSKKKKDNSNNA